MWDYTHITTTYSKTTNYSYIVLLHWQKPTFNTLFIKRLFSVGLYVGEDLKGVRLYPNNDIIIQFFSYLWWYQIF